ncbi:hypothetical protein [Streptomyces sp. NPDC059009]|uniref:hypothetical protein n=1 Tax=Streptomyces sp. NPDC059009 TaxID=3346694 RepID=UPI0036B04857
MPPKAKRENDTNKRPISITAVVDCVGALATGSVHGNLYLYDTNKAGGSTGFGTEQLRTRVRRGDQLLWNVLALECEAYVGIDDIVIDSEVCEPVRKVYPGTDIAYWTATVKKDDVQVVSYQIKFKLGSRDEPITTTLSQSLVG